MEDHDKIPILRESHKRALQHYQVDESNELSREFPKSIDLSASEALQVLEDQESSKLEFSGQALTEGEGLSHRAESHSPSEEIPQTSSDQSEFGEIGEYPEPATTGLFDTDTTILTTGPYCTGDNTHPFIEAARYPHYSSTIVHAAHGTIAACAAMQAYGVNSNTGYAAESGNDGRVEASQGNWHRGREGVIDLSRFPDLPPDFFGDEVDITIGWSSNGRRNNKRMRS